MPDKAVGKNCLISVMAVTKATTRRVEMHNNDCKSWEVTAVVYRMRVRIADIYNSGDPTYGVASVQSVFHYN